MRPRNSLNWFGNPAKQPKLAEQWKEAHWVGKSERSDEHLLAIRGSTCSARAIRRKPRDEQWNLANAKAVFVSPWELRVRTELDAPPTGQKYTTNHCWTSMVEHRFAQDAHWVQDHIRPIVERDSRPFGPEVPIRAEAQVARRALTLYQLIQT